jgi:hypothetical protein
MNEFRFPLRVAKDRAEICDIAQISSIGRSPDTLKHRQLL